MLYFASIRIILERFYFIIYAKAKISLNSEQYYLKSFYELNDIEKYFWKSKIVFRNVAENI